MTERLRFLLVLAALALAGFAGMMVLRARGGDDATASKERAEAAFARDYPMKSGKFKFSLQAKLNGVPGLADPFVVSGTGAFEKDAFEVSARPSIPAVAEAGFPGFKDEVGAAFVKNVLYVTHKGTSYRLGDAASLGAADDEKEPAFDGRRLLDNPRVVGTETIDGVETEHVSADIDVAAFMELASEQNRLDGAAEIEPIVRLAVDEGIDRAKLDLWAGKDDTLRRVTFDLGVTTPDRVRDQAQGFEGADMKLEVSFTDIGKPQTVRAPRNARDLGNQISPFFQGLTAGLNGDAAPTPEPSKAATGKADPADYNAETRDYLACVANAAKPEALEKCIAGLR